MSGRRPLISIAVAVVVLLISLLVWTTTIWPWISGRDRYDPAIPGSEWSGIVLGIAMLLLLALIIGAGVWLLVSMFRLCRPGVRGTGSPPGSLDGLRERFARSEITREQFEEMRRDIETR